MSVALLIGKLMDLKVVPEMSAIMLSFGVSFGIGVLFGYGDRQELETAGATYIAETVNDILKFM